MSDGKVHIALVADQRYWPGLEATKRSMLAASRSPERLVFHVFGEQEVAAIGPDIRRNFGTYKGSVMAFVRLFFPQMLPNLDWLIYADVDTLWFRDPCELWDLRDESVSVQWVQDVPSVRRERTELHRAWNPSFDQNRYACTGVLLMNLKRMRERSVFARCVEFAQRYGTQKYADQDILNSVLCDDAGMLPVHWDVIRDIDPSVVGGTPETLGLVLHVEGIGKYFHASPGGRLPQFDIWYKCAYGHFMLSWSKRFIFRCLAVLYPILRHVPVRDEIKRAFFFAWLRNRFRGELRPFLENNLIEGRKCR